MGFRKRLAYAVVWCSNCPYDRDDPRFTKSDKKATGWYVTSGKYGTGRCTFRYSADFVEGPYRLQSMAKLRAQSYRNRRCFVHEDCKLNPDIGRLCFEQNHARPRTRRYRGDNRSGRYHYTWRKA